MEAWLLNQGPLGIALLVSLGTIRKLYGDLQKARENERTALLDLLKNSRCENSDDE